MVHDDELVELRDRVDCRAVPEHAGWLVDKAASSRRAVKYRRGAGEIIVVTHEGKGWFEPLAEASCGGPERTCPPSPFRPASDCRNRSGQQW